MIRRKVMEYSIGLMGENMKGSGKMGNSMGLELIHLLQIKQKEGNGMKERE
jgi:hypothetical protein